MSDQLKARIRRQVRVRLSRLVRLKRMKAMPLAIRFEQIMLVRHRRGFLKMGRAKETQALLDKYVTSEAA